MKMTKGQRVKIFTSNKEEDPNTYQINSFNNQILEVVCEETGKPTHIHSSRVREVLEATNDTTDNAANTTVVGTLTKDEVKAPKTKKKKKEAVPVDFDQLIDDGNEIWTKVGLNFDFDHIKVASHCMIQPDQKSYFTFNTYNGRLGKSGSMGKLHEFSEKNTLEKKRTSLEKKGYVRHTNLDPESPNASHF